jgi:hypothetical protein
LALALHRFCLTLETGDRLLGRIHERVECGPGLLDALFRHGAQFGGHFKRGIPSSLRMEFTLKLSDSQTEVELTDAAGAHPTRHSMLR